MIYKVGELRRLVSESSNEFKAVLGAGVESENKSNNGKAYSEAKKRAKDYDGGLEKELGEDHPKYVKTDGNKTTLDYNPENVSKEYKDRVKAQVKGFTSTQEMNNGIEKAIDEKEGENIYNGIKDAGKEMHKNIEDFKRSGLQARVMPKETFEKEEMYESRDGYDMRQMIDRFRANDKPSTIKEHVKTVYFKKTAFLNEEHMRTRIPDEFKNEGAQFKMKDKNGNTVLVEWKNGGAVILEHSNKSADDASLTRIKNLFDYKTSDSETTKSYRINEGEEAFADTLEKMRKIIK